MEQKVEFVNDELVITSNGAKTNSRSTTVDFVGDFLVDAGVVARLIAIFHKKNMAVCDPPISFDRNWRSYYVSDEVMLQLGSVKHYAFVDDLQPIHITAEVLEKNGFTHDKWSKRIWVYEDEESEVVYYFECSRLEITTDDCKMYITCKGVAELQHALRLAKVGKEIEV